MDFFDYTDKSFDKILLDVPCSGTGTINKNPDIKIRRHVKDFIYFRNLQLKFLEKASNLLKKGGHIVYSTCSLCENENWSLIKSFLNTNNSFKIVNAKKYINHKYVDKMGALNINPYIHKLDGMFAVRLELK